MKKVLVISSLLIIIIVISGTFILLQTGSKQPVPKNQEQAEWAIRELLKIRDENSLDTLVMGAQIADKKWDFRGVTRQGDSGLPVYGIIKLICKEPRKKATCWNWEVLNRNGRDWKLTENAAEVRKTVKLDIKAKSSDENPPEKAKKLAPHIQEENSPEKLKLWSVKGQSVNGRTGPGTRFKISEKINPETKMYLIESKDGWGKFQLLISPEKKGRIIWVWMDLAKEINLE